jgi:hypothetical protein
MLKKLKSREKKAEANSKANRKNGRKRKAPETPSVSYAYDNSFEVLMFLARLAKAGHDVNAMLLQTVEQHIEELSAVAEFQVAMGTIPRPADAPTPWLGSAQ